ncbi:hypothetical protein RZS08_19545, partial [Arthrospira platensis SPKY1]|nr:hypothetical protein [Arthrospira platensis SPKY1]
AAFLIADTSVNATHWQLPTSPFNTITTAGNTFTITAPNGDTMQGTILHPANVTLSHGSRPLGGTFSLMFGGALHEESELNPRVNTVNYLTAEGAEGNFLVTLTIQPAGVSHPPVSRSSGT